MERELKETVYSPDSELLNIPRLLGAMGRDLLAARELAWRFLVRHHIARPHHWPLEPACTFVAGVGGSQRHSLAPFLPVIEFSVP